MITRRRRVFQWAGTHFVSACYRSTHGAEWTRRFTEETLNQPPEKSFVSHAKVIGALTLVSRVFGLLRETALLSFFGTGIVASSLTIAFTVPNLFRKLFGEGALSAAFIPLYAQSVKGDHPADARAFASSAVNLLTFILVGLTLLGEIGLIAALLFADPRRLDVVLTIKLSAIMLPYVVLICLTAFLGAILQVHSRFGLPAFAPVLLNVIHIAVTVTGGWLLGISLTTDQQQLLARQMVLANWLAVGVLVAGLAQIAMLIPSLRAIGFTFNLRGAVWTPAVKRMLKLSIPLALAAGVLQISVLMDKGISWFFAKSIGVNGEPVTQFTLLGYVINHPLELGAVRRLDVAQVLYQFPLGIFAIALATAIFPGLSASALDADRTRFRATFRSGVESALFEGIAASVGLIIVRYQVVRLLMQYGKVTNHDVDLIARSLAIYASGVWAYSLQQIINRAYYALHDTRTPLMMAIVNIALNLVIEIPLLWSPLAESGMAVGTTASFAIQSLFMLWMLKGRVGDFGLMEISRLAVRLIAAAILMFLACQAITWLPVYPAGHGKGATLGQLVLLIGTGAASYLFCCHLMRIHALQQLLPARLRR